MTLEQERFTSTTKHQIKTNKTFSARHIEEKENNKLNPKHRKK